MTVYYCQLLGKVCLLTLNVVVFTCPFLKLSLLPFPDTEDASETDLAKHDEDDYVEIKEQ